MFGQYTEGEAGGHPVRSYRDLPDVAAGSTTPTYAAIEAYVDNWRWQGVPFYLRTGKALAERVTEIAVTFKEPPVCFFHGEADDCGPHGDVLYLRLQPGEGFRLDIDVKVPGASDVQVVPLRFDYADAFGPVPDAYSTLLRDVIRGDQTHFVRSDWVEASWSLYDPILDRQVEPAPYPAGTWGPPEAEALLPTGRRWATGTDRDGGRRPAR